MKEMQLSTFIDFYSKLLIGLKIYKLYTYLQKLKNEKKKNNYFHIPITVQYFELKTLKIQME